MRIWATLAAVLTMAVLASPRLAAESPPPASPPPTTASGTRAAAREAFAKAVTFFRSLSTGGGYAGIYSPDLKQRWGESTHQKVKPTHIWIQPPGTPTVGGAYLRAYRATGDKACLAAARDVGRALWWGQRKSGGWDYLADMTGLKPDSVTPPRPDGRCTFDDRTTQGAIAFLADLDRTLDEPWLDDAVALAFGHMLRSQFPNGAWPQAYPLAPGKYSDYYTFNDGAMNDCIALMAAAHKQYGKPEYLESAKRGGDFIIASQVPDQPGWAQQYSHDMKPAWARAFEPPCISAASTSRNIRSLVDLYVLTRDEKYLKPIPPALEWLDKSKLADRRWARMYEVGTNKPIYGDRDGKVHYTLAEVSEERRTGYSWESDYHVPESIAYYEKAKRFGPEALAKNKPPSEPTPKALAARAAKLEPEVRKIIAALDPQGRWVVNDKITTNVFIRNLGTLGDYVGAVGAK